MNAKPPTILTNLQRGNVKQENPVISHKRTVHELAAQGELYHIEPQMVNATDIDGMTPLHWAAGYGQNSTVEFLLRSGANPNCRSIGGKTALMLAASKGFFHVVKSLITDGVNLNETDDTGNSALIYAAHQDHALVIQELVRNGADLNIMNIHGQTAYSISLTRRNRSAQAALEAHLVSLFNGRSPGIRPWY